MDSMFIVYSTVNGRGHVELAKLDSELYDLVSTEPLPSESYMFVPGYYGE